MNSCCEFAVRPVGKEWVGVGRWPRRVWYAKRAGMSPSCFIKGGFTFYSTLLATDKLITPPLIYQTVTSVIVFQSKIKRGDIKKNRKWRYNYTGSQRVCLQTGVSKMKWRRIERCFVKSKLMCLAVGTIDIFIQRCHYSVHDSGFVFPRALLTLQVLYQYCYGLGRQGYGF